LKADNEQLSPIKERERLTEGSSLSSPKRRKDQFKLDFLRSSPPRLLKIAEFRKQEQSSEDASDKQEEENWEKDSEKDEPNNAIRLVLNFDTQKQQQSEPRTVTGVQLPNARKTKTE